MAAEPVGRRQRRRRETIEEIIDVAVEVMAENGAAGLALGEVARRMGIKPPSLYVYFDSKNAIYDAVFARGWTALLDSMAPLGQQLDNADDGAALLLIASQHFTRWAVENRPYAELMFWRPVPGYTPSEGAFVPATEMYRRTMQLFGELQRRDVIRVDVDTAEVTTAWTVLISGVISQHLSNEPAQTFAAGRFTRLLPALTSMFLAHYGPKGPKERADDGRRIR
jgi:AcrR family transcriptional regulator